MSELIGGLPAWLMSLLAAVVGVLLFTLVESFVKKRIRERNKKEKQQQKSTESPSGGLGGSAVVQVRSAKDERDRYKAEANEKAKELATLRNQFKDFKRQHGLWESS